jgi:hypothetical protein
MAFSKPPCSIATPWHSIKIIEQFPEILGIMRERYGGVQSDVFGDEANLMLAIIVWADGDKLGLSPRKSYPDPRRIRYMVQ